MTDTKRALLTILNPDATVPQLEEAADELRAAHPERPRAYLVTLLAAEALQARAALEPLQCRLETLEQTRAKHLLESCESCVWQDGDTVPQVLRAARANRFLSGGLQAK